MTYDPAAQIAMDSQPLIKELKAQEQVASDRNKTRDVRREAEDQAKNVRKKLLHSNPNAPTVIRTYFTATGSADAEAFKTAWQEKVGQTTSEQQEIKLLFDGMWGLPTIDLATLPFGSFTIQFTFTLAQPYLSKDDNPFYIIDNPIVRDKVFRLPMVRSTSWKGSLRHALWQMGYQKDDAQIQRIFGDANDDQPDAGRRGRLYFYPTFFTKTSLEIINPHDRERGVGKNPILLESVPIGATGTFTLLYAPLDRIGEDKEETRRQVAADLTLIAHGVEAMLALYGFGAKTSSGFGLAGDVVHDGVITLNIPDLVFSQGGAPQISKPEEEYMKYLDDNGQVRPDFVSNNEGGLLSNQDYKQKGEQGSGGSLSEFKKFRSWYNESGIEWAAHLKMATTENARSGSNFKSLSELAHLCQNIQVNPAGVTRGAA